MHKFIFVFLALTSSLFSYENSSMDAQSRNLLDILNANPVPMLTQPIEQTRQWIEDTAVRSNVKVGAINDLTLQSLHQGYFPVRIYTPEGKGPFPVLLYYHGGGWVFGSINMYDNLCRILCRNSGAIVVSVGYRLAPEFKFPIPVEDSFAAAQWAFQHIQEYNGDPSKIALGGDSAGGNLTAAVTLLAKEKNFPKFAAQILIYPVTSPKLATESYERLGKDYMLTKEKMRWFWNLYLGNSDNASNPLVSPLDAKDLSGLPPALFILAKFDPLYDEGLQYAEKLKQAGVSVKTDSFPTIHGFLTLGNKLDITQEAIDDITSFLKGIFR